MREILTYGSVRGSSPASVGRGIYSICPPALPAEGGLWGGGVSAIPAKAGRQNRKIFVSLIENNFGGARIKKCLENFSVLLAEAKRRRAETLGGLPAGRQGFNPQNPLDFAQNGFGFRPINTTFL